MDFQAGGLASVGRVEDPGIVMYEMHGGYGAVRWGHNM